MKYYELPPHQLVRPQNSDDLESELCVRLDTSENFLPKIKYQFNEEQNQFPQKINSQIISGASDKIQGSVINPSQPSKQLKQLQKEEVFDIRNDLQKVRPINKPLVKQKHKNPSKKIRKTRQPPKQKPKIQKRIRTRGDHIKAKQIRMRLKKEQFPQNADRRQQQVCGETKNKISYGKLIEYEYDPLGYESIDHRIDLLCYFCQRQGNEQLGKLIKIPHPSQGEHIVHSICALWSTHLVFKIKGSNTFTQTSIEQTISLLEHSFCQLCGKNNASLYCYKQACERAYHFTCFMDRDEFGKILDYRTLQICCNYHSPLDLESRQFQDLMPFIKSEEGVYGGHFREKERYSGCQERPSPKKIYRKTCGMSYD